MVLRLSVCAKEGFGQHLREAYARHEEAHKLVDVWDQFFVY